LLPPLERAAGRRFPPERIPDPEHTYPVAELESARLNGLLLVAAADADAGAPAVPEEPAGFAVCTVIEGWLHLEEVSVHPDHGRRGLGRRLVDAVAGLAEARGLAGVTLTTFEDVPWNAPFYGRMGFQVVPDAEMPEWLAARLADEAASGLTRRVAMRRPAGASE
jgi:GNAT superfamily N-acetyltransferase